MANNTFQARLRTTGGRAKSAIDARTHRPVPMLTQNLAGPIQVVLVSAGTATHEVGFIPAGFVIERIRVITPAGAGTVKIDFPAYNGAAAVAVVAALASATSKAADLTLLSTGLLVPFDIDRPLTVATVGVTGTLRLGIFGFPIDNGASEQG
jgi:hypothetical protein